MQIWLTGLPCSGKTTIARALKTYISNAVILDGDDLRKGICSDLGFDAGSRRENLRRAVEIASLLEDQDFIPVVALIAPYRRDRDYARERARKILEVFVDAPLHVCIGRDCKGMYAKASRGEIKNFTGYSDPYEVPDRPDLVLHTETNAPGDCVQQVLSVLAGGRGNPVKS